MIDKINDEFIVDCTNNSKEERQQVYKFLVDNRNYDKGYLGNDFSIIVCNKNKVILIGGYYLMLKRLMVKVIMYTHLNNSKKCI